MAYNKKNYYRRIIEVQNLVLAKKQENEDLFLKEIYWNDVYPKYHICEKTFHTYLGVNAKRDLEILLEKEEQKRIKKEQYQPKLALW